MIKKETFAILTEIKSYWDRFEIDQDRIDKWHQLLQDYDFTEIMNNLNEYVKTNRFAPSISDLIKVPERRDRAIPNNQETKDMLASWEKETANKIPEKEADEHLANIRKLLGIE